MSSHRMVQNNECLDEFFEDGAPDDPIVQFCVTRLKEQLKPYMCDSDADSDQDTNLNSCVSGRGPYPSNSRARGAVGHIHLINALP